MWFEVLRNSDDAWQWRLVSDSANTVAVSPRTYDSRAECLYAIALAMSAQGADVRELGSAEFRKETEKPFL
jgi:uncharacterized protein YegP (UPF0339 family)